MMSIIQMVEKAIRVNYNNDYKNSMLQFQKKTQCLRFGYVPGIIKHFFHGSKINRRYGDRHLILLKYDYSPLRDIIYDEKGVITPSLHFANEFKKEIIDYFWERNEDE